MKPDPRYKHGHPAMPQCLWESLIKISYKKFPYILLRFLDDIFFIWDHGMEALKKLFELANTFNPTIKFTFKYSLTKIYFLDVTLLKNKNRFETGLFRKRKKYLKSILFLLDVLTFGITFLTKLLMLLILTFLRNSFIGIYQGKK